MRVHKRLHGTVAMLAAFFLFAAPAQLYSAVMSGGQYEIVNDNFSFTGDDAAGGGYSLYASADASADGYSGDAATATITINTDNYLDFPTYVIGDGANTVSFVFFNRGGDYNATCVDSENNGSYCSDVYVDSGGAPDAAVLAARLAESINSSIHALEISATSAAGVVSLVNTREPGENGNITIIESGDDSGEIDVSGFSGGSNDGYSLKAGFQGAEYASLSLVVSSSTLSFGQLSTAAVSTKSTVLSATTESSTGYNITIQEDTELLDAISGTYDIDDVSDGTVTAGSEEYGFQTSGAHGQQNGTDTAITTSPLVIALGSDATTTAQTIVTFSAAISATASKAGSYSHTITFTGTANP